MKLIPFSSPVWLKNGYFTLMIAMWTCVREVLALSATILFEGVYKKTRIRFLSFPAFKVSTKFVVIANLLTKRIYLLQLRREKLSKAKVFHL